MELFLWRNFQMSSHPDAFIQYIPFIMFNIIVEGHSFFHIYSDKSMYIEKLLIRH